MNNNAPSTHALIWLILGISLGALPHFSYQPLWVALIFSVMIGWRCMHIWRGWPLPSKQHRLLKWLHLSIAAISVILLINSYGTLIGRDAGVALLTVMLGLKVVEIRNHRDYYLSCFLGYFLVVTNFFYSQSMPTAILMFIVVAIMTTCLISLNDPKRLLNDKARFKLASQMLLQAIPVMLLLFVFFPRIAGPLWGLPQDAYGAKTGLSNSMSLDNISQLIQSDEIAFRVKFEGPLPKKSDQYWRGPVLWHTDGTTWTGLEHAKLAADVPKINSTGTEYRYTTTLEPHNDHWLFALDFPQQHPEFLNSHFTQDGQLRSNQPVKLRQQYRLSSQTQFTFNASADIYLAEALQLPEQHPRTKQLAQQWLAETQNPRELIQRALNHFNQQAFFYTLTPPVLAGDGIDNFLFESRRGFCQHYAASFTILMRAAGIPTRVVTGYQGGEINPIDDFLVVRQRDAHAWTEVWLENEGWIRIDPTAAVASERIEEGMSTIMPLSMRSPLFIANSEKLVNMWQNLRNNWEALDNRWNQWIISYGPKLQKEFLSKLGISPNWQSMVIWMISSISIILLIISAFLFYQRQRQDPLTRLYHVFCKRSGIERHPSEGPLDFAVRMKQRHPHHASEIDLITARYINLQYGNQSTEFTDLQRAIKQFRPTPRT